MYAFLEIKILEKIQLLSEKLKQILLPICIKYFNPFFPEYLN